MEREQIKKGVDLIERINKLEKNYLYGKNVKNFPRLLFQAKNVDMRHLSFGLILIQLNQ